LLVQSDLTPPKIIDKTIEHNDKTYWLVNTGVPHLVTFDADIDNFDTSEARELRYQYNANVNIAKVQEDGTIRVRTYERGVEDETLACGTGMAACFYRANQEGRVGDSATVYPTSGDTLYLGLVDGTITFKGEVTPTFTTTWK
jgi:diaminopimelate epimerase